MKCAVRNCCTSNRGKASKISFFTFPTNEALLAQWVNFCRRDNCFNPKNAHICMKHFKASDFANSLKYDMGFAKHRALKRGTVPTIYKLGYSELAQHYQKREYKKIVESLLDEEAVLNIAREDCYLFIDGFRFFRRAI